MCLNDILSLQTFLKLASFELQEPVPAYELRTISMHEFIENMRDDFCKATSRSQGKIAQSPKEPISIQIIRMGIRAVKTGVEGRN